MFETVQRKRSLLGNFINLLIHFKSQLKCDTDFWKVDFWKVVHDVDYI